MFTQDKRIRIITGFYGSGKSEFALNYAVGLSQLEKKVALADLDVVNTYFRSREQRQLLADHGIKLISSSLREDNTDLPALSAQIVGPLQDKSWQYIMDMGGNDVGLLPLAWLGPYLPQEAMDIFMVVNINRTETATVESILHKVEEIERGCGYKITGFVHNTNLIRESSAEDLLRGQEILLRATLLSGIPLVYTAYWDEVKGISSLPASSVAGQLVPMKLYLRKDWM